jgi:hypothetical protein
MSTLAWVLAADGALAACNTRARFHRIEEQADVKIEGTAGR